MRPLRRDMQIVFQDPFGSLSPRLSVSQIIEEGLLIQDKSLNDQQRRARVSQALTEVGLDPATQDRLAIQSHRIPGPAIELSRPPPETCDRPRE